MRKLKSLLKLIPVVLLVGLLSACQDDVDVEAPMDDTLMTVPPTTLPADTMLMDTTMMDTTMTDTTFTESL